VQNKLVRVLQEREVKPVGGDEPVKVDVRVLSATNKNLRALVAAGRFREDLYWRLAVVPVEVPPLRDRREDVPLLVAHFLGRRRAGAVRISPEALARLAAYRWPGNIRELENVVERAALLAPGDTIRAQDLPPLDGMGKALPALPEADGRPLKEQVAAAVRAVERQAILDALRRVDGSPTQAARLLGMSRASLYNKIREYDLAV
jgi:two-component system response regulator HydG